MGKKKGPSALRRPLTAYQEFLAEERPRILLQQPDLHNNDVNKELGKRWKNLGEIEKQKYKQISERKKEASLTVGSQNREEMQEKTSKKKARKKKDPAAPKLPLSSFLEFGKLERPKVLEDLGNISVVEMGRELGRRWQSLSSEEKEIFDKKAKENREVYEEEKKRYEGSRFQADKVVLATSPDSVPSTSVISTPSLDFDPSSQPDPGPHDQEALPNHLHPDPVLGTRPPRQDLSHEPAIQLQDLGFAKQKKYPWHPALKTGELGRGTRVKVQFFGTGQTGTVDKSKWIAHSEQVESRIKSPSLMKAVAFKRGLEQLRSLRAKLENNKEYNVTASGIEFVPEVGVRKFRNLKKDDLQKEEEENLRQMERKMFQEEGSGQWRCRDCDWSGKFRHKAKAHARDCGQRRPVQTRKSSKKRFECSNPKCDFSFPLYTQLVAHYRSAHSHPNQVYSCVPCQKTFKEWKNFKRHELEKHGPAGRFKCSRCPFRTNRNETLMIHFKRKHSSLTVVSLLLEDIIGSVVKGKNVVDSGMDELPSQKIVLSVLQDLICEVVEDKASDDGSGIEVVEEVEEISEYEKLRNIRIAQIRAQFELFFPEKTALQVVRREKKKQSKIWQVPFRRSSRIQHLAESVEESISTADDRLEDVEREHSSNVEWAENDDAVVEDLGSAAAGDACEGEGMEGDMALVAGNGDFERAERDDNLEVTEPEESNLGRFACIPCNMPFRDSGNLRRHVQLLHSVRAQALKCPRPWCDKEFTILADMIHHKERCLKICASCGKSFTRQDKFKAHLRAHETMKMRMI